MMTVLLPIVSFVLFCLVVWSLLSLKAFSDIERLKEEGDKRGARTASNRSDIVDVYESRLAQLDEQLELKIIEHEQYLKLKADLEIDILNISKNADEKIDKTLDGFNVLPKRFKYSVLFMIPLLVAVSILFYIKPSTKVVSDWEALKNEYALNIYDYFVDSKDLPENKKALTGQEFLVLSQSYLQKNPKDAAAWFELGLLHLKHGSVPQAIKFFSNAKILDPKNQNYNVAYAQALIASDSTEDVQRGREIAGEILQDSPKHEMAWMTYALANQKLENFQESIDAWQKLKDIQAVYKTPSPIFEEYLAKAKKELKLSQMEKAAPKDHSKVDQQDGSLLDVNIAVDESIAAQLSNGILFVIVKYKDRPMPIAVKRIENAQLPVNLSFSDADSLMPTTKLSAGLKPDVSKLEVLARYSFKGVAAASPGDYFSQAVSLSGSSANLTIDQEVK